MVINVGTESLTELNTITLFFQRRIVLQKTEL